MNEKLCTLPESSKIYLPAMVFRSLQPAVLEAYLDERARAEEGFNAKVAAYSITIGGRVPLVDTFSSGDQMVRGMRLLSPTEELPAGWRRDGCYSAVPALRTPEGKKAAAVLAGLQLPGPSFPGAPTHLTGLDGSRVIPRLQRAASAVYLTLASAVSGPEAARIAGTHWARVPVQQITAAVLLEAA
ncbi:hypothetical protein IV500_05080 [Paeniglutamicibacter antarcticus]|uniref:Uncharacterized protein n=1 Tax=Arthrobacter terrae TaxID=2935737 RepID=A0A931G9L1_9MICC|nr:hypothetical protein [Arthrobacter terrae]MBG0738792.1 hypothetical protein [Arthrobacter terrae]